MTLKRVGVTGFGSAVAREFREIYEDNIVQYGHDVSYISGTDIQEYPLDCDEYLLCAGVLHGERIGDLTNEQLIGTWGVNFINVARFCDNLFEVNDEARVVVIGSESGFKGSYDMAYAGAKAALHLYVETKRLRTADQHLVCVAPTVIEDTGMTQRRADLQETLERGKERRLGRWLQAAEVARIAHFALKESALCNTVIRANGGNY